ncbi:MAG: hypothetical protein AAF383_01860 [Cyanobacteria bacterium P01_A01_bin.83]
MQINSNKLYDTARGLFLTPSKELGGGKCLVPSSSISDGKGFLLTETICLLLPEQILFLTTIKNYLQ